MEFSYKFPAIRGLQADREYYTTMIPLKLLPKLFLFNEESEDIPAEYRAQRSLNTTRIPQIGEYILKNRESYVFSSLTASIDGDMNFEALDGKDIGYLVVNMDAKFLINDGQHRRASIEYALERDETLREETISIVIFKDKDLKRSQQMFADLNRYAITPNKSIGILYDSRDPLALLTKELIEEVEIFKYYTDKSNSSLAKYSAKAFTLNNIYAANKKVICDRKIDIEFINQFWKELLINIKEFQMLLKKEISASEMRKSYILACGTWIEAMGIIGNYFYIHKELNIQEYFKNLNKIDWNRENIQWKRRVISEKGRIMKNNDSIKLTATLIKKELNIPLTREENELEKEFNINANK